ncbi:MAG: hypothetical protein ACP5QP_06670 [Brevinematia bacterium]
MGNKRKFLKLLKNQFLTLSGIVNNFLIEVVAYFGLLNGGT